MEKRKILFCTVDSWNTHSVASSANTYINLFDDYPQELKAALFIREEYPDSDSCSSYFQISERKVINSIFHRSVVTGKVLTPFSNPDGQDIKDLKKTQELYNKNRKKRSYLKLFIRELIWKCGNWKSKALDDFVDSFKPDIIIFSMEGYIHFNRICRYVTKRSGAKAIGYFWDDTFTYKQVPGSIGFKLYRFFQRVSLKKTVKVCSEFWAITPKTKQEADVLFNINSIVITKPLLSEVGVSKLDDKAIHSPIRLLYTGNLAIGRYDTLKILSDVVSVINKEGCKVIVDVYTNSFLTSEQREVLNESITIHDPVTPVEVLKLQRSADVLLFMEDMVGSNSMKARLSFSTKITDYLSAGKCILALGPRDIAPMDYLITEDAALCATSVNEVYRILSLIAENSNLITDYGVKAMKCGKRNHDRNKIKQIISDTLDRL